MHSFFEKSIGCSNPGRLGHPEKKEAIGMDWQKAKTPALNIEEAALLPALPRRMDGGAALLGAIRNADRIKEKQVSGPIFLSALQENSQSAQNKPRDVRRTRAALNHVLNK